MFDNNVFQDQCLLVAIREKAIKEANLSRLKAKQTELADLKPGNIVKQQMQELIMICQAGLRARR